MSSAFDDVLTSSEPTEEELTEEEQAQIQEDIIDGFDTGSSSRGKLIPFSYYGGKYKHLNWLLPLLPQKKAYVEPFGGSGVVLLNREQSDVETFNDTFEAVTTFFKVLRDQPDELLRQITLSPYSERDFEQAVDSTPDSDLEKARQFFLKVNQSYNNDMENPSWSYNKSYSSRGVSKKVSNYQAKPRRLQPIADRLKDVQITNRDAVDVIETFDCEDGLIYCDPPYPPETRSSGDDYVFEMSVDDHREMASTLRACEADVAVSSYSSELYHELFVEHGWSRVDGEEKGLASSDDGSRSKTESLYVNYEVTDEMLVKAFE